MILCEVDFFLQEPSLEGDSSASYELSTVLQLGRMSVSALHEKVAGDLAYSPITVLCQL